MVFYQVSIGFGTSIELLDSEVLRRVQQVRFWMECRRGFFSKSWADLGVERHTLSYNPLHIEVQSCIFVPPFDTQQNPEQGRLRITGTIHCLGDCLILHDSRELRAEPTMAKSRRPMS